MLQRVHSGDGCVLVSTLCKYDLRKGGVFVLSWARVRRVMRRSISSELLMYGGSVRSILLLPRVAIYLEAIDVLICFYVCCSDCVGVCGNVCVVAVVENSGFFCLGVLKYVVCLCRYVMDVVFSVCVLSVLPVLYE